MIESGTRVLTDENLHPEVVSFLRREGGDVLDVREEGLTGVSDEELIRRAEAEHRIVITHDRDFGRLLTARGQLSIGVIYLRPGHIDAEFTIGTLQALSEYDRPNRPFIVVAERRKQQVQVRVRPLT